MKDCAFGGGNGVGMIHTLVDFRSSCDDWGILLGRGEGGTVVI